MTRALLSQGRALRWLGLPILLLSHASGAARPGDFGALPPSPDASALAAPQILLLELIVNGQPSGIIATVSLAQGRFELRSDELRRAGLPFDMSGPTVFLDELPGVDVRYDAARQLLNLTVAPEMLPSQRLGLDRDSTARASGSTGALLNYEFFISDSAATDVNASMWHEARFFTPRGVFSSTGVVGSAQRNSYTRFDTRWSSSSERNISTLEVGDLITRGLPWASAVRLGGVQLSRDFSVRPDVITYPLPEFSGAAALPSTVDLFVNDQRVAGGSVRPGPFQLDTLPPINGVGEANLVVTDMLGRSFATTMPFYVSSALLRPGLTDYAASFGAFRQNYGLRNFDYGQLAASASVRHGVSDSLTLEGQMEGANDFLRGGAGAVVKLGTLGIVDASYSLSRHEGVRGSQVTFGYEYQARRFSFSLRHSRNSAGFADLGTLTARGARMKRIFSSVASSLSIGELGNIGVAYIHARSGNRRAARLANASWSAPFLAGSRIYASVSRDFNRRAWGGALSLSIPLAGHRGSMNASAAQEADGPTRWQLNYARNVPSQGGVGWSGSVSDGRRDTPYMRGDVVWRSPNAELRAGAYGDDAITGWASASGSIVAMDGGVFTSNRVADSFVVVSTNGEAGIPVYFENQLAGQTDGNGHLLIPWGSAYYAARYDINPMALPANVKTPIVSQQVAVSRGSGQLVSFPIERMRAARAIVVDGEGKPLEAGSRATINDRITTYVGWDGLLFLEDIADRNKIELLSPEGDKCTVYASAQEPVNGIMDLGTLKCLE